MIRIESGIDMLEQHETLHQQTGTDQQDKRQRQLGNYECAAQATASRSAGRPFACVFERMIKIRF